MKRTRKPKNRGFVLVEVMCAMTVFALSAGALVSALKQSVDAAILIHRQSAIRLSLSARLNELKAKPFLLGDREWEEPDANGISFQESIFRVDMYSQRGDKDPVLLPGLFVLQMKAKWEVDGQPQEELAQVMILRQ